MSIVSIVVPVYNEAANIAACLRRLHAALGALDHEILVCYDFDGDTTLPAIEAMTDRPPTVRLVKNTLGKGAANALRAGFAAARGDVVVTTMADLSDPPETIPSLANAVRAGADVVAGSRYMDGGAQNGGPVLKGLMSRAAGWLLHAFAGLATRDATNNFRAYSKRFLDSITIESKAGFEIALELTVKAHLHGFRVAEVPSTWTDRTAGESRFRLLKWLPNYLRWFFKAAWVPTATWFSLAVAALGAFILSAPVGAKTSVAAFVSIVLTALAYGTLRFHHATRGRFVVSDLLVPWWWFLPQILGWLQGNHVVASLAFAIAMSFSCLAISVGPGRAWNATRSLVAHVDQRTIGLALLAVVLWLSRFQPATTGFLGSEVDDSWRQVYGWALKHGVAFGHDLVFTHGPLGYFKESPFDLDLYVVKTLLYEGLFMLGMTIVALYPLRYLRGALLKAGYLIGAFLVGSNPDTITYSLAFAAAGCLLANHGRLTLGAIATLLGLALLTLVKFTFFVVIGLAIGGVALDRWLRGRFASGCALLAVFGSGVSLAWAVAGQSLADFPGYVLRSIEIARGYNHAMALRGADAEIAHAETFAWWLAGLLCVHLLAAPRSARRWASAAILAAGGFVLFKASFVRQLESPTVFFSVMCAAPFALLGGAAAPGLLGAIESRLRTVGLLGCVALAFAGIGITIDLDERVVTYETTQAVYRVERGARAIAGVLEPPIDSLRETAAAFRRSALPRTEAIVGDDTIDAFGNHPAYILHNGMNYRPRPVFQSYSAYSERLMELNAAFYRGPDAPHFVLLTPMTIDGDLPTLADGRAFQELLRRYRARFSERSLILLERDPNPRPLGDRPIAYETKLRFGEWFEVPAIEGPASVVELDLALSAIGRRVELGFKVHKPTISLRFDDGAEAHFTIDRAEASHGFVFAPFVGDDVKLRNYFLGRPVPKITALRIAASDDRDERCYEPTYAIRWRLAPDLVAPQVDDRFRAEIEYPGFDPKPVHVTLSPDAAVVNEHDADVLLCHAPSALVFATGPGDFAVRGAFGLLDSSWLEGATDGVHFSVVTLGGAQPRRIFDRTIDPRDVAADRGRLQFFGDVTVERGEKIVFAIDAGPAHDQGWDWAYWGDLVIEPKRRP